MRMLCASIALTVSASAAGACPSFGLPSDYLAAFFCQELAELAGPRTRNADLDAGKPDSEAIGPDWLEIPAIRAAWRSDPAKTLRLIERIREAGGRAGN
ncbi:MAG: hypothetical protein AAF871_02500 [Pseudomonadota bacterium]